jgi:N4-(beta-N-acetylglucosaminyl)-L-asparaginase
MSIGRRTILRASVASLLSAGAGIEAPDAAAVKKSDAKPATRRLKIPCVVSTWDFGVAANQGAWNVLVKGGRALDAIEAGARVAEDDLKNHSVGRAGYPDRDGHVSLDASIMDENGNCGSVAALEHIGHPISVARRVMEKTPHVMLVGDGALQFALEQGFNREELLTPESRAAWQEWLRTAHYQPQPNSETATYGTEATEIPGGKSNHDTLGMLAIDSHGKLSGGCTTSGMAWKLRGRVGDSPIIGAGLYVDNDVGAATSTGVGEEVIRNVGSFLVVELMRHGRSPQAACKEAVTRIMKRNPATRNLQIAFLAINKQGEVGAWALQKGFSYACCDSTRQDGLTECESFY